MQAGRGAMGTKITAVGWTDLEQLEQAEHGVACQGQVTESPRRPM